MTARTTAAPDSPIPPDERDPYSPAAGQTPSQARHRLATLTTVADTLTRILDGGRIEPTFARAVARERDRIEADAFELQVALRTATAGDRDLMDLLPRAPLALTPPLHVRTAGCAGCGAEVALDDAEEVPGMGLACSRCAAMRRWEP